MCPFPEPLMVPPYVVAYCLKFGVSPPRVSLAGLTE
jgi:hypothetical protein